MGHVNMERRTRAYLALAVALLILASLACSTGGLPGLAPAQSSPTPTATITPAPTLTPTFTPVVMPSRIASPTPAVTSTYTLTPTFTPPPSATPSFTPTDTPGPGDAPACSPPAGGFGLIYQGDSTLQRMLGCPTGPNAGAPSEAWTIQTAVQPYENGLMVWVSQLGWEPQKIIYVLFNDGTYQRYLDAWQDGMPESGGETPPEGRFEPVRGFGKIWREQAGVRGRLGWALQPESGGPGQIQRFARGEMVYLSQAGQTYIFVQGSPSTWRTNPTPF
ncbi:MAG: hypothetical protein JXB47_15600 [Anaerolineae bacterium]|nr:hypothetical protein [Anaerolineae bacterium]